jgi:SAM-dependent methyltransferase
MNHWALPGGVSGRKTQAGLLFGNNNRVTNIVLESRTGKWPKRIPPLTEEQQVISDDFVKHWHEKLPTYSAVEHFNHGWIVKHAPAVFGRTLEIGAGLGEHIKYERLTAEQEAGYWALELRENMAAEIRVRFPRVQTVVGDCQETLQFPAGYFDRVVAVHVLEHLPNLPAAIKEVHRLCDKERGTFQLVIPCEGGLAYGLCRRISAQRIFEKRYSQPYRWFIEREHINLPREIMQEIEPYFTVQERAYFPVAIPFLFCNLCIAMNLRPKPGPAWAAETKNPQ